MNSSGRNLPRPPHNPGVRDLVEGKQARDIRANRENQREGFRGWHERGYLPHRDSPGLTQFITYRLADSFPVELRAEWSALLQIEDERERRKKLEAYLDRGLGACWLRREDISEICEHAFLHFNDQRYELKAWCIMPNHVHVLVSVTTTPMAEFIQNWKGFTSYRCNRLLGKNDSAFWAEGYWDTYMRNSSHELRAIRYIENNPVKARLVADPKDWPWSSARFRNGNGALRLSA